MGTYSFRMPDVGEGIAEAELVEWFVAVGDTVARDQTLAEVLTDKASVELPSPVAGTVTWLGADPGSAIAIGAELIRLDVDGLADHPAESVAAAPPSPPAAPPPAAPPPPVVPEPSPAALPASSDGARRVLASPAVRRRAMEAGIDLALVRGSGPAGRVEHHDLDAALAGPGGGAPVAPSDGMVETPVIGLRRKIAERMALAKARIPHITYVDEVDVTELEGLRGALNTRHAGAAPKLTLLPFLLRALVVALAEQPALNAHHDDDAGILRQFDVVHAGVATQTPRGLVVPVLRHAGGRSLWDCAGELVRLATGAREGTLAREELTGSTITVTSLGALGGLVTTPIINHPEVAIVGVNKIRTQPVWNGTGFQPRQVMNLSCGFDHRVVDGWDAAIFVQRVKALLEQPATLFVEGPRT